MIDKSDNGALGIGSYGAVYRAKIGQLPCAAKVLHPTLFQIGDPSSDRIRMLFEQECQVLRRIRHPHVIQYIKSFHDPDSHLPVLLMELMDESLTHYLECRREAVPHHIQLNISHDVALALEFLHGIGVIHRDLSSNNVLLIAGKRAKVTDFGMAKLWEGHTRMTPATFCPGTMVYMPPEALKVHPVYSEKLDCFSAGVVFLQILTQQFPNPGDRVVQVDDRMEMRVPELERREAHISLVRPDHPLLLIALDCMHEKESMRPSAQEICIRIDALKGTSWHDYVVEQEQLESERPRERRRSGGDIERDEEERRNPIENGISVEQLEASRAELREKISIMNDMQHKIEEIQEIKSKQQMEIKSLTESLLSKQQAIYNLQQDLEAAQELIKKRDSQIAELQTPAQASHGNGVSPTLSLPPRPNRSSSDLVSFRPASPSSPDMLNLKWRLHGRARRISGDSSAVSDSNAYFADGSLVLMFNSVTDEWTTLPPCPKHSFAIVVVGHLPTAVGGFKVGEGNVKTLLSLTEGRKWTEEYPPMSYQRKCPAAASTGHLLVVAGGCGSEEVNKTVEVLDTRTMSWSVVTTPLPLGLWRATAVVCGDRLYLGGGCKDTKPNGCLNLLYCSLSDLQTGPVSLPVHKRLTSKLTAKSRTLWHPVAKLPMLQSTIVPFLGHLLAIGGESPTQNTPVPDVFVYSPSSNSWRPNGSLVQPRSKCFAVPLPNNRLMVLGGSIEPYTITDTIEIASVV